MTTFQPGTRIALNDHNGTVRWVGQVQGTKGSWLGVEWDDPARGKHDGVKDGVRYFHCSVPGAGSFIRETPAIVRGRSFLAAFVEKYIDDPSQHQGAIEKVTLGSSNGVIEVEAVNLNKIRSKLLNFASLREVSLDSERVSSAGEPNELRDKFPRLRGLDLTRSLIGDWQTVIAIAGQLPALQSLSLNYNRFQPLTEPLHTTAFTNLSELRLNGSLVSWDQASHIPKQASTFALLSPALPALREVQLGYNRLSELSTEHRIEARKLETLNVDGNQLHSWANLMEALRSVPMVSRLVATMNVIANIPPPPPQSQDAARRSVHYLSLSENKLASWSDVDALAKWLPELKSLSLTQNPIMELDEHKQHATQFLITRIPTLETLNGSAIPPHARQDAELYYMTVVSKQQYATREDRLRDHPRWTELCQKYGEPGQSKEAETSTKLSERLVSVRILVLSEAPSQVGIPVPTREISLRVLKTMNFRTFRAKVMKSLKITPSKTVRLWYFVEGEQGTGSLEMEGDRDLEWWDIEEGSKIGVLIE
ncbi:RNI-like protein [Exidia glandulosa HHB12029]|uniref:RNI-like protein n=1 Tax=Exidia glandulosa HHB12029 TaxID=1314781 RepID=A0A166AY72_EXIGL|nr:RNI-like protein [Exidia glandulosa HHB12029]